MSSIYSRQLLKIVVAQLAKTFGYQSAQPITLDILGEILERYIVLISKTAKEYAELGKIA